MVVCFPVMSATMMDIAKDLKVSVVTVSKVLRNQGRISDATTLLRDTLARCERTLPPGDPLTQTVRESLTNIAG